MMTSRSKPLGQFASAHRRARGKVEKERRVAFQAIRHLPWNRPSKVHVKVAVEAAVEITLTDMRTMFEQKVPSAAKVERARMGRRVVSMLVVEVTRVVVVV